MLPYNKVVMLDSRPMVVFKKRQSTITLDYDDNPDYAGEAVRRLINDVVWNKEKKHFGKKQRPSSCLLHLKLFREEALTGGK